MITVEVLSLNQIDRLEKVVAIAKAQLSTAVTMDLLRSALESPATTMFVALNKEENDHDTKVIGTATLGIIHCISGIRGHIEDVVVDEKWRGKGVGKLLLEKAISTAVQYHKVRTLDLTSRPDRVAANGLYKKMGFIQRDTNVYRYQPSSLT
ncbi:acyl-CoA N-acyltransferase [Cunninghamella echinulata]|nr:acyl-CoA N-acyltransferase [Cunninghamella echinulata]